MKNVLILLVSVIGLLMAGSCSLITDTTIAGDWKLKKLAGTDYSSNNIVYTFSGGTATIKSIGGGSYPVGTKFTYKISGASIIITGGSNAGILDGTYVLGGATTSDMYWELLFTQLYTFSKN